MNDIDFAALVNILLGFFSPSHVHSRSYLIKVGKIIGSQLVCLSMSSLSFAHVHGCGSRWLKIHKKSEWYAGDPSFTRLSLVLQLVLWSPTHNRCECWIHPSSPRDTTSAAGKQSPIETRWRGKATYTAHPENKYPERNDPQKTTDPGFVLSQETRNAAKIPFPLTLHDHILLRIPVPVPLCAPRLVFSCCRKSPFSPSSSSTCSHC